MIAELLKLSIQQFYGSRSLADLAGFTVGTALVTEQSETMCIAHLNFGAIKGVVQLSAGTCHCPNLLLLIP